MHSVTAELRKAPVSHGKSNLRDVPLGHQALMGLEQAELLLVFSIAVAALKLRCNAAMPRCASLARSPTRFRSARWARSDHTTNTPHRALRADVPAEPCAVRAFEQPAIKTLFEPCRTNRAAG